MTEPESQAVELTTTAPKEVETSAISPASPQSEPSSQETPTSNNDNASVEIVEPTQESQESATNTTNEETPENIHSEVSVTSVNSNEDSSINSSTPNPEESNSTPPSIAHIASAAENIDEWLYVEDDIYVTVEENENYLFDGSRQRQSTVIQNNRQLEEIQQILERTQSVETSPATNTISTNQYIKEAFSIFYGDRITLNRHKFDYRQEFPDGTLNSTEVEEELATPSSASTSSTTSSGAPPALREETQHKLSKLLSAAKLRKNSQPAAMEPINQTSEPATPVTSPQKQASASPASADSPGAEENLISNSATLTSGSATLTRRATAGGNFSGLRKSIQKLQINVDRKRRGKSFIDNLFANKKGEKNPGEASAEQKAAPTEQEQEKEFASRFAKTTEELDKAAELSLKKEDKFAEHRQHSSNRLISYYYPDYRWYPTETTLCHRKSKVPFPHQKSVRFFIEGKKLEFEFKHVEPLFLKAALYDLKNRVKLSEDFHFHLNDEEALEFLHFSRSETLKGETKALFSVTDPHEDIYLVVFVDRMLLGSIDDAIKPYTKELSRSERTKVSASRSHIETMESIRQPFLFGFNPLFVRSGNGNALQLIDSVCRMSQFYTIKGDANNAFDIFEVLALKEKLGVKYRAVSSSLTYETTLNVSSPFAVNIPTIAGTMLTTITVASPQPAGSSNIHTSPANKSDLLTSPRQLVAEQEMLSTSTGSDKTGSLPQASPYAATVLGTSLSESEETISNPRQSNSDQEGRKSSISDSKPEIDEIPQRKWSVDSNEEHQSFEDLEKSGMRRVQEIPVGILKAPFMTYLNNLYVYPQTIKLEKISKVRNIAIEVMFRTSDTDVSKLTDIPPRVVSKYENRWRKSFVTSVSHYQKSPQFFDEIKVDMPVPFDKKQHVLFVFYNLNMEEKGISGYDNTERDGFGASERGVIGFAFLPLLSDEEGNILADTTHSIHVYKHLPNGYLTPEVQKKMEMVTKSRFHVKTKVVSTVYPSDTAVKTLFSRFSELQNQKKMGGAADTALMFIQYATDDIRKTDTKLLLPYLPTLLNLLFRIISSASTYTSDGRLIKDVRTSAFSAIIALLKGASSVVNDHSRKNTTLASYVAHMFNNAADSYPVYAILPSLFEEFLSTHETSGVSLESSPGVQEAPAPPPPKETRKLSKFATLKSPKKTPVKNEAPKKETRISAKHAIQFSWFFFDVIVKSVAIFIKGTHSAGADIKPERVMDEDGWNFDAKAKYNTLLGAKNLKDSVLKLITAFTRAMLVLSNSSVAKENYRARHGNRHLALFIRDLLPILKKEYALEMVDTYMKEMRSPDPKTLKLKLDCLQILLDYNYLVAFVHPKKQAILPQTINHVSIVMFDALHKQDNEILEASVKLLLNVLVKRDYDARYQDKEKKEIVAELFFPIAAKLLETDLISKGLSAEGASAEGLTMDLYVCLLWMLRTLNPQKLLKWWRDQSVTVHCNVFSLLENAAMLFALTEVNPKLRKEAMMTIVDLTIPLTAELKPVVDKIKAENITVDLLKFSAGSMDLLAEPTAEEALQNPLVFQLMDKMCKYFSTLLFTTRFQTDKQIVHSFYTDCVGTFVNNFMQDIVVFDLYKIKKLRRPEREKFESRWRLLLGAILAHAELPTAQKSHPAIVEALQKVTQPYNETMSSLISTPAAAASSSTTPLPNNHSSASPPFATPIVIPNTLSSSPNPSTAMEITPAASAESTPLPIQDEDDIIFNEKLIKAATLERLIHRLIVESKDGEKHYNKIFLVTYQSFTTPFELLLKLIEAYNTYAHSATNQIKLLLFVSDWVKESFHGFDNYVIAALISFLDKFDSNHKVTQSKVKKYILKQLLQHKTTSAIHDDENRPAPEVPKNFDLAKMEKPKFPLSQVSTSRAKHKLMTNPFDYQFDLLEWPSIEIARQMTLIEADLFRKIEPKECFGLAWSKNKDMAPNLVAISERFNNVNNWVQRLILGEYDIKRRQQILVKLIDLLKELRALNNFASINQITSALNSAAIHRLAKTWEILGKEELKIFKEYASLFENPPYNQLRKELTNAMPNAAIPFVGMFQTELTFIEDGNKDFVEGKEGRQLINFFKRRLYNETIMKIKLYQQTPYNLTPIPYLEYILTQEIFTDNWDDKFLYSRSLDMEKRK